MDTKSGRNADQRTHDVHCHVLKLACYSVTFQDFATPTDYPWLVYDTAVEVAQFLKWGHVTADDLALHHDSLRRWGVGGAVLRLTTRQRHQLVARRVGWPWNGQELMKMKEEGKYPPALLSSAEEQRLLKMRR